MSIDSHFIHSCDVRRYADAGADDAHGLRTVTSSLVEEGVACRLVRKKEFVGRDERGKSAVVSADVVLFPVGTDVNERDVIEGVTLEDGTELSESFVIEKVITRRARAGHHITVAVESVS